MQTLKQKTELPVLRLALASLALALAACSPEAAKEEPAGAETATPNNPLFGSWEVSHARIAPWWKGPGEEPAADPALANFSLQADKTSGAPLVTCDKPKYATNIVPARGLFQGNLPEPAADAAGLGFTSPDITVLTYSCESGTADISLDFAMLDENQILLAVDNVIYTFQRTGQ